MKPARSLLHSAVLLASCTAPARAQHCHVTPPTPGDAPVSGSIRVESATFRTLSQEGTFQGVSLSLRASARSGALELRVPAYRLVSSQREERGAGDLFLRIRAALIRALDDNVEAGALFGATLPTAQAGSGLGMGHVMLFPGVYVGLNREHFSMGAELSLARAVPEGEHDEHAHHGVHQRVGSLVEPMTGSEIMGGVSAVTRVQNGYGIRAGVQAGVPFEEDARAAAFFGPDFQFEHFGAGVEWHLPLAGEPFSSKIVVEASARY